MSPAEEQMSSGSESFREGERSHQVVRKVRNHSLSSLFDADELHNITQRVDSLKVSWSRFNDLITCGNTSTTMCVGGGRGGRSFGVPQCPVA